MQKPNAPLRLPKFNPFALSIMTQCDAQNTEHHLLATANYSLSYALFIQIPIFDNHRQSILAPKR